MQKNKLTAEEISRIEQLVDDGKTINEIAEITGRSTQTIVRVKARMGTTPVSQKRAYRGSEDAEGKLATGSDREMREILRTEGKEKITLPDAV